jgi:hypothetical protein
MALGIVIATLATFMSASAEPATNGLTLLETQRPLAAVLPPAKWRQVEASVDRALAWLAQRQAADGSFVTTPAGQPGVTSLCIMAFLSRGHQPGIGPYGRQLNRAIDYTIACQKPDGMFSLQHPGPFHQTYEASHTAAYNHAIAGLMLGEVYGQVTGPRAKAVKQAIGNALQFTRHFQHIRPKPPYEEGGWRYLRADPPYPADSDLSITAWQLMFLRSARNAEFNVPQDWIDEALGFVRRCWDPSGMFNYALPIEQYRGSRGTVGAGIVSLSMAGQHQTPMALASGDWLVAHPFRRFGETITQRERFFYSIYYCSQASAQLGGHYWERFFPSLAEAVMQGQQADGSWPSETGGAAVFGNTWTTAMSVLSLTPPYQLLPVYQR